MSTIFFVVGLGVYDMYAYPMRVVDNKMLTAMDNYDIGECREIEYLGKMTNDIGIYEIITTNGFYHVYFSQKNKQINVEGIKELLNDETIKWSKNLPQKYKNFPTAILELFIDKKEYSKNIKNIEHSDVDEYIITYKDNSKYRFDIKYYKVYQIYDITNNHEDLKYTCKTLITFKDDFQKIINKNMNLYKNVKKIVSYEVTEDKIEYTFENFCGNLYKIIKYNDDSYDIQQSDTNISKKQMEQKWKLYQEKKGK